MTEFVRLVAAAAGPAQPGIGTLVLSRPPNNAMTRQFYRELVATAGEASRRADISAVIVFGGHEIFSAGDDVPELRTLTPAEAVLAARARHSAVAAVAAIRKPTVAAITGYALGSGLALALAADWRVSGDNVRFGATEILAGLTPDSGGLARLTRAVGASRAKELVYSGRFFDAEEALELGLIDEMTAPDAVYDAAAAWADRIVRAPAPALAAAKAAIDDVFDLSPAERLSADLDRYIDVFAAGEAADRRQATET